MKIAKKIEYFVAYIVMLIFAFLILKEDAYAVIQWWLCLLILGICVFPITMKAFHSFHDRGYLFAKMIGLALAGYLMWVLSSVRLMKFDRISSYLCIGIILVVSMIFWYFHKKENPKFSISKETILHLLNEELIFLFLFIIWCYIKGFRPDAHGTEKFMDYGFMSAIMRSDYMPPKDLWFSGAHINYYYFGQYLATFMTKISRVTVGYGYNLMLITIATMSMMLPYSIVYNAMNYRMEHSMRHKRWLPSVAGAFAAILVSCSSNMHYLVFRFFVPMMQEILGIEVSNYWFPNSTRYIGYRPDVKDKTIHEFPAYSTVLGDLHAHYINLIFVLTVIGLLLAWYIRQEKKAKIAKEEVTFVRLVKESLAVNILLITFFIGLFHMTNYWDYPIYYVVAGAIILFSNIKRYQNVKHVIMATAIQGVVVLALSSIVALPFTLKFVKISSEIFLTTKHTRFYQFFILWGFPIIIVTTFIVHCIRSTKEKMPLFARMHYIDLFFVLCGLCAIGLVFMPEVIYVKDIYGDSFQRANTMFKLTYQAYILFGLCEGYILIWRLIEHKRLKSSVTVISIILALLSCTYIVHSVNAWFGNIFHYDKRETLDASSFLLDDFANDYDAIQWLNDNISGQAVILEAQGDSYSDCERISVFTGLQTVLGWHTHEWLWQGDLEAVNERSEDVKTIYTSTDHETVKELIKKYQIEYIYIGDLEREQYGEISEELLQSFGEIAFISADNEDDMTYIIKINSYE